MRTHSVLMIRDNRFMSDTTTRALQLLDLLQTHRHWSGPQLCDRLGVTTRTLRRDIDRLRELGYRIESAPGSAGGYRLEAGSAVPPLLLTNDEAVTMAIGLRLAATQGLVDGELTTLSALAKLEQVLPSALRERVRAVGSSVEPFSGERPQVSADLLAQLALVCRDNERIRFHYVAAGGDETDRLVEPYSLVAAQRQWFLVAWDVHRDDWRTFRVDRMSAPFPTRVRFAPRELPADDAAEFVRVAVSSVRQRIELHVDMDLPIADMLATFGPWGINAQSSGPSTTDWPIGGATAEELVSGLAWVPAGVEYRLPDASDEVRAAIHEIAGRMLRASANPDVADSSSP